MTIHFTPLSTDAQDWQASAGDTLEGLRPAPTRIGHHIFVALAIAVVASALTLFLVNQFDIAPNLASLAAFAFAITASGVHLRLARPAAIPPKARTRKIVRRQPSHDSTRPDAAPPTPSLVAAAAQPATAIEPSDLAVALLASLKAPTPQAVSVPQPPGKPWTWAQAAHLPPASLTEAQVPAGPAAQSPASPAPGVPDMTETEFERVDRLVKRLADNVNQLQAMRLAQAAAKPLAPTQPSISARPIDDAQPGPFPEPAHTQHQLEASINALRRSNAAPAPLALLNPSLSGSKPLETVPAEPPHVDPHAKLRTSILQALNAQRIDVFLEPILDLADHHPQHYEVSIALLTHGGHEIDLTQAATDLSGTGLLPLMDQARIAKAAGIARRLADRGKSGAVFAELNGETLEDGSFQQTFANDHVTMGAFPGQLVLTLPQSHVATFTAADWHTLTRLREAGFGFALTDVTTLDMDFAQLNSAGFMFARLDAETFLIGLPTAGSMVPPADICRHLAACGLALIVGGIIEDHQLARIFGFGVLLGQGQLFGAPRPIKSEAPSPPTFQGATATAAE